MGSVSRVILAILNEKVVDSLEIAESQGRDIRDNDYTWMAYIFSNTKITVIKTHMQLISTISVQAVLGGRSESAKYAGLYPPALPASPQYSSQSSRQIIQDLDSEDGFYYIAIRSKASLGVALMYTEHQADEKIWSSRS